jgi:hypothetical protein
MKAGIADPEMISIIRQRHDKHVSAVMNNNLATEELLEVVFSVHSISSLTRMLHEDYDRRCSVGKKSLAVSVKGLGTKTN